MGTITVEGAITTDAGAGVSNVDIEAWPVGGGPVSDGTTTVKKTDVGYSYGPKAIGGGTLRAGEYWVQTTVSISDGGRSKKFRSDSVKVTVK